MQFLKKFQKSTPPYEGVFLFFFGTFGKIEKRNIFDQKVKLGRRDDKKEEKERGKKLLKFVIRPKREVGRIVLPSSQLHARDIRVVYHLLP